MRLILRVGARASVLLAFTVGVESRVFAHPGSGIVVDGAGQVYFIQTGVCIWKIDATGRVSRHTDRGDHWLALDPDGRFVEQRWPRVREHFRPGVIKFGDAEFQPVGRAPTLLCATSFPIAIGSDGALYYPDVGLEERVHIKRLPPQGRPTDFATLPLAMEIAPNNKPWKALWIHGLAAGPDGTLYYTEKEAVRRIDADGRVHGVAENIQVPGCVHGEGHRGGPILRGLDLAANGHLYVAAMACQAVLRITPDSTIEVALRSEESWAPTGVAVRGNDVYVLEFWYEQPTQPASWRPRVRKLSPDGSVSILATAADATDP